MKMKLGTHAYYIVSVTTTFCLQITSVTFITSLLKLDIGSTHGDQTWYTCILHRFHDDHMFVNESSVFHKDIRSSI